MTGRSGVAAAAISYRTRRASPTRGRQMALARIWARSLGEGHSAISLYGHTALYALPSAGAGHPCRNRDRCRARCSEWKNGVGYTVSCLLLRARNSARMSGRIRLRSSPQIASSPRGSRKQLMALDRTTGKLVWSHDLIREYGAPEGDRGYAASPLLYQDLLIVPLGGARAGAGGVQCQQRGARMEGRQSSAEPRLSDPDRRGRAAAGGVPRRRRSRRLRSAHRTPALAPLTPNVGRAEYQHPAVVMRPTTCSSSRLPTDRAAVSSNCAGPETRPRRPSGGPTIGCAFISATSVRIADLVIGASGDFGPVFLTAVDLQTGTIAWQDRSFARSQLVHADGKLIILDEDGTLGLATVSLAGLKTLARARILESVSWTPPTLVQTRLFVRDRKTIAAVRPRQVTSRHPS